MKKIDKRTNELKKRLKEVRKRKREVFTVLALIFMFILLSWVEASFFDMGRVFPLAHSVFFFGLINFNIILLLFVLFLIFRNIVKVFSERRGRLVGGSLKSKLIVSFVAYSIIPTVLMFVLSVFYINSSFNKWFSGQTSDILKTSLEVTNSYYLDAKKKNYYFAHKIAKSIAKERSLKSIKKKITTTRRNLDLDVLEYYPDILSRRLISVKSTHEAFHIPKISLELFDKGLKQRVEASSIHQFGKGNLIRVIVPVNGRRVQGAIVVSRIIPLSLISQMNVITETYDNYRGISDFKLPLKSIYLLILSLMALVIMFGATWFGVHLARQLSIPLIFLGKATRRVATGDYREIRMETGSDEIQQLINDFNYMTNDLAKWQREVEESNYNLKEALKSMDKHNRYIEMVLSNVSEGVVSLDTEDRIKMLNHHACQLLNVQPQDFIGKHITSLIKDEGEVFRGLLEELNNHAAEDLRREIRVDIGDEVVPLQLTLSNLKDSAEKDIGKIIAFDDLTPVINAQRAAAWSEVAKRIAHEIKNPLTPIKLSAERLQKKFGDEIKDPAFKVCTTMIIDMSESLKTLVNEFNSFARLPQVKPVLSCFNSFVKDLVTFYQTGYSAKFEFIEDKELPKFRFDPDQMKRVLNNLLENALSSLPEEGGVVKIKISYHSDLNLVRLSVMDNGVGIPDQEMSRVFEPYFSTKKSGTGLGLPIVKRIIQDHNGFIRVVSNVQGTEFVIELPVR